MARATVEVVGLIMAIMMVFASTKLVTATTDAATNLNDSNPYVDVSNTSTTITMRDKAGKFQIQWDAQFGAFTEFSIDGVVVSPGSRGGCLWGLLINDNDYIGGCGYSGVVSWNWSPKAGELQFVYSPPAPPPGPATVNASSSSSSSSSCLPQVVVTFSVIGNVPYGHLKADIQIRSNALCGQPITTVLWPSDVSMDPLAVGRVFMPLLPGVLFNSELFATPQSFTQPYPGGGIFSDLFLWSVPAPSSTTAATASSDLLAAMPTVMMLADPPGTNGNERSTKISPSSFGIIGQTQSDWFFHRSLASNLTAGQQFTAKTMNIILGNLSMAGAVDAYSTLTNISSLPSTEEKYNASVVKAFSSRMLAKMDANEIGLPFKQYMQTLQGLDTVPLLLHPCAFEPNGFDRFYPDLLPPDPKFGTTEDLAAFVRAAQSTGHLVMPYTNPTWWDPQGPTMQNWTQHGITLDNVTALDANMKPIYETYGPNGGYVIEVKQPLVKSRLDLLHQQFTKTVPCDLIFEDQIGARPWLLNRSPWEATDRSYLDSWVDRVKTSVAQGYVLMTEQGFDGLLPYELSFCGSAVSRFLGSAEDGKSTTPSSGSKDYVVAGNDDADPFSNNNTWFSYPFLPLAARKNIFFHQHNLDEATYIGSMQQLVYDIAFGYQLSYDLGWVVHDRQPQSLMFRPGSRLQQLVLSTYATSPMLNHHVLSWTGDATPAVAKTTYPNVQVWASFVEDAVVDVSDSDSIQGGFYIDVNSSIIAGSFTRFQGQNLTTDAGPHILVYMASGGNGNDSRSRRLYHLLGSSTPVALPTLSSCHCSPAVTTRDMTGRKLGDVSSTVGNNLVHFSVEDSHSNKGIEYYQLECPC